MNFIIFLLLNLRQSLIQVLKIHQINSKYLYPKNEFYIKTLIHLKINMFYFNQFLHNLSNQFKKNIISIRFERIQANYLYAYQTNVLKN